MELKITQEILKQYQNEDVDLTQLQESVTYAAQIKKALNLIKELAKEYDNYSIFNASPRIINHKDNGITIEQLFNMILEEDKLHSLFFKVLNGEETVSVEFIPWDTNKFVIIGKLLVDINGSKDIEKEGTIWEHTIIKNKQKKHITQFDFKSVNITKIKDYINQSLNTNSNTSNETK